jgi:hypothetical protein
MKRRKFTPVFVFPIFLLFHAVIYGQNQQLLKFTDGQEQAIVNNVSANIASIKITEEEFDATLTSFGKANPLAGELLDKLKVKNKKIYNQAKKITTSFNLTQDGRKFYIRGFNSIDLLQFRNGNIKVKCRILLIEIRSEENVSYLPIIVEIRKL